MELHMTNAWQGATTSTSFAISGKKYALSVVIGRFQPLHEQHVALIEHALTLGDQTLVIVGSWCGLADDSIKALRSLSAEKAALEKENDRLDKAWHAKHDSMVKAEASHRDYFDKSQRRMQELRGAPEKENERLTESLKRANANAERFEREWYLRGDEIESLSSQLAEARGALEVARDYVIEAVNETPYQHVVEQGKRDIARIEAALALPAEQGEE